MTKDDVIRMAREAGGQGVAKLDFIDVERFAALVAAAEREEITAIIREHDDEDGVLSIDDVLAAIRARGEK
jgi:hypothetical protein